MSDLPTADAAFPKPTADEAFPKSKAYMGLDPQFTLDGNYWDKQLSEGGAGHILTRLGHGAKQGWGTEDVGLPKKVVDGLGLSKDYSTLYNDWLSGQKSLTRAFNESLMRSTAIGLDLAFRRLPGAVLGAVGEAAPPLGALIEAFPAGHATGFPIGVHAPSESGLSRAMGIAPSLRYLDDAADLGLLPPREVARQAFAPDSEPPPRPAIEPELQGPPGDPSDIHTLARVIAPRVFQEYDLLAQRKNTLQTWIDELRDVRREQPEAKDAQARMDVALAKAEGDESKLRGTTGRQYRAAARDLDRVLRGPDTPEMAVIRRDMVAADERMRDLAPDVSAAYRDARDQIPPPEPEAPSAEVIPIRPAEAPLTITGAASPSAPNIVNLAQRQTTIQGDITRQLTNLGRPRDEARAGAAIWQAYYDTRAARLGTTARQLFDEEAPNIISGHGRQRGRFTFGDVRNTITLFENADASTFMHESGHQWLDDMVRDAQDPRATPEHIADVQTVREWLKAEGDRLTRAMHEKFARGFERYLMEGQAPSTRLASVFDKFKQWLTKLYQTVAGLKAPINDDIRGVYDRLLSRQRDEPVITAEREGARTFDEDHVAAVRETPGAEAETKASDMRAERDRVGKILSEAVDNARREARRGPERIRVPQQEGAGERPVPAREGDAAANEPISTGRNPPTGESETPSSSDAIFEPADGELVDKAGNIRVENLNVPDDVAAAIHQAAADAGGFITERRGTLTDVEVMTLADDMGLDPKKINRRKVGQAFNAEEIIYARKLVADTATKVKDAAAAAANGDTKALIQYGKMRERLLMVQGQLSGITAEAGRALRAFRELEGLGDPSVIAELFQKSVGTLRELQQEAQLVAKLDSSAKVSKFVKDQAEPTWKDYIMEAWINSLLSGVFTHMVNIVGNASVVANSVVETAGAATVGVLRGTRAVEFAEIKDRLAGIAQGSVEGIIAAGHALWDESVIENASHSVEQQRFRAIPSKVVNVGGIDWNIGGAQVRLPGRFLTAEDEFFRSIAMRQDLLVQARRRARIAGLEGDEADAHIAALLQNPTDAMVAQAREYAAYQTFTNDLGSLGRAFQDFANSHAMAKFIIPFVRTPVNLFKYAVERSPLGFAMREVRDNLSGKNGDAAKDTQIARMALGTMAMTAAGTFSFNGLMSGGGPSDPAQQATLRRTGWQPYSFRVGNTWIPYARFDPISTTFGVASDMAEAVRNGIAEDAELDKVAATLVQNLGKNLLQKTSLRGVSSIMQAIVDPAHYGETYLESTFGSLVPAVLGQTARAIDPEMREVHGIVDAWKSRIPVWRESLLPKRDLGGEPVAEGVTGWTSINADPVWSEMARLGLGKAPPDKKIHGVTLTPEQYDDSARIGGRMGKIMAEATVESLGYANAPPAIQKKLISHAFDKGHALGRAQVIQESLGSENDIIQKGIELKMKGMTTPDN